MIMALSNGRALERFVRRTKGRGNGMGRVTVTDVGLTVTDVGLTLGLLHRLLNG